LILLPLRPGAKQDRLQGEAFLPLRSVLHAQPHVGETPLWMVPSRAKPRAWCLSPQTVQLAIRQGHGVKKVWVRISLDGRFPTGIGALSYGNQSSVACINGGIGQSPSVNESSCAHDTKMLDVLMHSFCRKCPVHVDQQASLFPAIDRGRGRVSTWFNKGWQE